MDPIRALELWTKAPQLVVSVMDARLAREAYHQSATRPREMSAALVDFYVELTELAEGIRARLDALGEPDEDDEPPDGLPD